jgi:acyl-phosphate glycerol 3-phosphate acyltransferase
LGKWGLRKSLTAVTLLHAFWRAEKIKDTFFPKARPIFVVLAFLLVCLIYFGISLSETLFVLLFYAYGSVPFALIFTYFIKDEIIYEKGSRNVGVANAFWVGGLPAGFLTVVGETSKALLALFVSNYYFDSDLVTSIVFVFSAMLGTNFSVFLKGKGGMGRTVLIWALLILAPISVLLLGATWLVVYKISKDSYRSSIINNSLIPVVLFSIERSIPLALFGLSAAILYYLSFDESRDEFAHYQATNKFAELFAKNRYIINLASVRGDSKFADSAGKLDYLRKKGFKTPETYICTFRAYEEYVSGKSHVLDDLEKEIGNLIDSNKHFSIKPSANIEDTTSDYFAGQSEKYLNLKGPKPIVEAIEQLWESIGGASTEEVKLAVIIQEMVCPEFSGLVFTKNPINGMDEVIVESVLGSKDASAREKTPHRWVHKWGELIERPEDKEDVLPIISEVIAEAKKIAKKFGKPVSLMWAYDGKEINWLQLREINQV